jgi:membrane protein DedA with SNARE-associated domain
MLLDASVTNSLVTFATNLIHHLGLGGVLMLTLMSAIVFVPGDEATMLFAGFNVYQHHLTMLGIIAFGVLGDVIGGSLAYLIGYFGLNELLEKIPGPLHLEPHGLERAQRWFDQYGTPAIAASRLIPLGRAAMPYAAGISRINFLRFLLPTVAGSIIWIGVLGFIGRAVGSQWPSWRSHLDYVDYAVVAIIVVAVIYFLFRRTRGAGKHRTAV